VPGCTFPLCAQAQLNCSLHPLCVAATLCDLEDLVYSQLISRSAKTQVHTMLVYSAVLRCCGMHGMQACTPKQSMVAAAPAAAARPQVAPPTAVFLVAQAFVQLTGCRRRCWC